jgi:hypothetical protein
MLLIRQGLKIRLFEGLSFEKGWKKGSGPDVGGDFVRCKLLASGFAVATMI